MCKVALCFLESAAAHFYFFLNSAARCYSFVDTSMKVFAHVDEQFFQIAVCERTRAFVLTIKKKKQILDNQK